MAEKSTVFQNVQIGVETTPGTAVAANKKLVAASILPGVRTEGNVFRALGNKYPTFAVVHREWSEFDIEGGITYNDIVYLLSSLISSPTPVQQGTTAAYKWTFSSSTAAEDAGKTLTVEQGDATTAWRAAGVKVSGLEFTFDSNKVELKGTALGRPLEYGITMTANPTSLAPKPILASQLSVRMADTRTGLATANALTRGFNLSWQLTGKNNLVWAIGQPPVVIETVPSLQATLRLATDTVGIGIINTTMRSGATKWFRIKAVGETIEDTYQYTFMIDFPAQVAEVSRFEDVDGIYAVGCTLQMIHDASWGKAFEIEVVNEVQSL